MRKAINFFLIISLCAVSIYIFGVKDMMGGIFDWFPWYNYDYRKNYACRAIGGREGWDCAYDILLNSDQQNIGLLTRGRILIEVTDELVATYKLLWEDCHWGGVKNFYRDGCGFGWYPTDKHLWVKSQIITPTKDPLSYPWSDNLFTSYNRYIYGLPIKLDQSNMNESFLTDELKNQVKKWNAPAIVCIFLKGDNQPPTLIGCIPDYINPYPPVFNEIVASGMRASVKIPQSGDQQSKWYKSMGSTFENPAAVLHYYEGSKPLKLASDKDLLRTSEYNKCFGGQSFDDDLSMTKYYGFIDAAKPNEICVYHTKCVTDLKDNEIDEYKIGCTPRPGVLDNSKYTPVIDFTLVCDSTESDDNDKPQYGQFDTQSGYCVDSKNKQINSLKPRRALMLAFIENLPSTRIIGTDYDGREIIVGTDYTVHLKDEKNANIVHGTFLELLNKPSGKGGLYRTIVNNTTLTNFAILASNGITDSSKTSNFFRMSGGYPEHKVTGKIENVLTTFYVKDDYRIIPQSLIPDSCFNTSNILLSCRYPEYVANVIIPAFKQNNEPDIIYTDIQFPSDGHQKNCTLYKSVLSGGRMQLYQPANINYRDFNYCTCNEKYTKCKEGAKDCACQLCSDTPEEVKYAACHGEYGVEKIPQDVNPSEEQIHRDKICFYVKDDWDFLTGMSSSNDGYWGENGKSETKKLFCANLPVMCYPLKSPADWNGNAIWEEKGVFSGKVDVIGECAIGYEPRGRKIELKPPSMCAQDNKCVKNKQTIESAPVIYDRKNRYLCKDKSCKNIQEIEWITNYRGDGSEECREYFHDEGCFVTPCITESGGQYSECDKELMVLYSKASSNFDQLKKEKESKDDVIRESDLLSDIGIRLYIEKYSSCCGDKPSGYTNEEPSDAEKPKADCVAGIYENFKNPCVKK